MNGYCHLFCSGDRNNTFGQALRVWTYILCVYVSECVCARTCVAGWLLSTVTERDTDTRCERPSMLESSRTMMSGIATHTFETHAHGHKKTKTNINRKNQQNKPEASASASRNNLARMGTSLAEAARSSGEEAEAVKAHKFASNGTRTEPTPTQESMSHKDIETDTQIKTHTHLVAECLRQSSWP